MAHTRKTKKKGEVFERIAIHDLNTKIGKYEIEEFRSFYVVRKKLQHPTQKGFYDPTAMVVAKQGKIPVLPTKKYGEYFGWLSPLYFYHTGIKGKDNLKHELDAIESGLLPVGVPKFWDELLSLDKLQAKSEQLGDIIYEKTHKKKVKK